MKIVSNQLLPQLFLADFWAGISGILGGGDLDFSRELGTKNYLLTSSARTGLGVILDSLEVPKNRRAVAIPAFMCAVVALPFLARKFRIFWIDSRENGLVSELDFAEKIKAHPEISVAIFPKIFGQRIPDKKFVQLQKICQQNKVVSIEDAAHFFSKGESKFCDFKLLSFGREKDVSCVSGGGIIWGKNADFRGKKSLKNPPFFWTARRLFSIFIFSISLPIWKKGGKVLPYFFRKVLPILPLAVSAKERKAIADFGNFCLPRALQKILKRQFFMREKIQNHRQKLTEKWNEILPEIFADIEILPTENNFRVIGKFENEKQRNEVLARAKKSGFALGEWDGVPISPDGIDTEKFQYVAKSCPNAENFARKYITFPTNLRTDLGDLRRFEKIFLRAKNTQK